MPIQAAPIGRFAATPELPAAVARAGGHGMVAVLDQSPDELAPTLTYLNEHVPGVYGVNFVVPLMDRATVELAARTAPLVEFHYGTPDAELVELLHREGALASWQVGSELEARQAADAGADVIVVQGIEAAGRTRGRAGTLALLTRVLDVVTVPVVAAGGIGSARGVAAVLAAGAIAARVGTRFLGATEAAVPEDYREAVLRAAAEDTVLTARIAGPGPQVPARMLAVSLQDGDADAETAFFAGESATFVEAVRPAAEIVHELATGAERLLQAAARATLAPVVAQGQGTSRTSVPVPAAAPSPSRPRVDAT